MNMRMKRLMAMILAMLVALTPLAAFAEEEGAQAEPTPVAEEPAPEPEVKETPAAEPGQEDEKAEPSEKPKDDTPAEPETPKSTHKVTFFYMTDGNKHVIDEQTVEDGGDATLPEPPAREKYIFSEWVGSHTNITSDAEIEAKYKALHTVSFFYMADGNKKAISQSEVPDGGDATPPEPPVRVGFAFTQWSGAYTNVTADVEVEALYEKRDVYKVQYVDSLSGKKVKIGAEQQVTQGGDAVPPAETDDDFPTHVGYKFVGWDNNGKNVQDNLEIEAKWQAAKQAVTFYDDFYQPNPKIISTVNVDYGGAVDTRPDPPAHDGYIFFNENVVSADPDVPASLTDVRADMSVYYMYMGEDSQKLELGKYTIQSAKPGATVTIPLPLILFAGDESYYTNQKAEGSSLLSYWKDGAVRAPGEFSQALFTELGITSLTLDIDTSAPEELPFTAESLSRTAYAVVTVDESNIDYYGQFGYEDGDTVCTGYAAFTDMKLKSKGLSNTYYKVPLVASWTNGDGEDFETTLEMQIQVTGVRTSGGGGGGGGGGGTTTETPNPQAKLIVESIETDPEEPSAGDEFDIKLTLRNTSETLLLQNLELTYTSDDDALLPVSGSNTVYIPLIAANATYEQTLRVKAKSDLAQSLVKLNVEMAFEDKKLTALTASQTMMVNVKQVQKIKLDELVLPTGETTANNSYDISLGVYNAGRTTLYNVTAQVVSEDDNLAVGQTYFAGNMETGTSKTIELEAIPLAAGDYSGNVRVTYETVDGAVTEELKPFSFTAGVEEEYTYNEEEIYTPEPVEEETNSVVAFLGKLNWWVYALAGALLLYVVIALGVSARNRRRRAFEEDEMD